MALLQRRCTGVPAQRAKPALPMRLVRCHAGKQRVGLSKEVAEGAEIVNTGALLPAVLASGMVSSALLAPLAAIAEEVESVATEAPAAAESSGSFLGFSSSELAIVAAPLVFYTIFNIYRDRVNPRATLLDGLYIAAALIIIANIISIIFFKVRFF